MPRPPAAIPLITGLAVEIAGTDALPEWLRLVPAGAFTTVDGRTFTLSDAGAAIAASPLPLAVDFDHAIDRGPANGQSGAAAGWVEDIQARDDGLYGRVMWNTLGRAALSDRQYRFLSPVIAHQPDGTVTGLRRVALTNNPAVPALSLLSAEPLMDPSTLTALRAALGLPEAADGTAIVAAVKTQTATLSAIAGKIGAAGTTETALLGRLDSQLTGGQAEVAVLRSQLSVLSSQLSALTGEANKRRIDELVAARKIPNGAREQWLALLAADPARFDAVVATLVPMMAAAGDGGAPGTPPADGAKSLLSAETLRIAGLAGHTPEELVVPRQLREIGR